MKPLALLALLLSACPERHTTYPGMAYKSFETVCNVASVDIANSHSVTTTQNETLTITLSDTEERRNNGCVGTFTFVNDKLESISR